MNEEVELDWEAMETASTRFEDELVEIRKAIESYVSMGEDWVELAYGGPEGPAIVRRTTKGGYLIEVSAIPKDTITRGSMRILDITETEALELIDGYRSPAITTKDFSDLVGCSDAIARAYLHDLFDRGVIQHREAGDTDLWWIEDETELNIPDSLKQILEMHKEEGETIREAYSKFKGNPTPELIADITGEPSEIVDTMRDAVMEKRERGKERRKSLRNRLNDS